MLASEFDFHLPEELIAQEPLADRSGARMLVLHRGAQRWEDRHFVDLPQYLAPGDCLILNDSRVIPSRLFATRAAGPARIEVFLVRALNPDATEWTALVRPGRKVQSGETLFFRDDHSLRAEVLDRGSHGERTLRFTGTDDIYRELEELGHVPLPPYIRRQDTANDRDRYQTVFAREKGSVAAPTAGLHFTPAMMDRCRDHGAEFARVTLHVGLGTFAPLADEEVERNTLHTEAYAIDPAQANVIRNATRRIAVGTTSVRATESAYRDDQLHGDTNIFIYPGYRFHAIDAMLTNFHLPKSSLIMLVAALAGKDFVMAAYRHAVEARYRFFSYGDCMLVLP